MLNLFFSRPDRGLNEVRIYAKEYFIYPKKSIFLIRHIFIKAVINIYIIIYVWWVLKQGCASGTGFVMRSDLDAVFKIWWDPYPVLKIWWHLDPGTIWTQRLKTPLKSCSIYFMWEEKIGRWISSIVKTR